jgi:hypothetical protein
VDFFEQCKKGIILVVYLLMHLESYTNLNNVIQVPRTKYKGIFMNWNTHNVTTRLLASRNLYWLPVADRLTALNTVLDTVKPLRVESEESKGNFNVGIFRTKDGDFFAKLLSPNSESCFTNKPSTNLRIGNMVTQLLSRVGHFCLLPRVPSLNEVSIQAVPTIHLAQTLSNANMARLEAKQTALSEELQTLIQEQGTSSPTDVSVLRKLDQLGRHLSLQRRLRNLVPKDLKNQKLKLAISPFCESVLHKLEQPDRHLSLQRRLRNLVLKLAISPFVPDKAITNKKYSRETEETISEVFRELLCDMGKQFEFLRKDAYLNFPNYFHNVIPEESSDRLVLHMIDPTYIRLNSLNSGPHTLEETTRLLKERVEPSS